MARYPITSKDLNRAPPPDLKFSAEQWDKLRATIPDLDPLLAPSAKSLLEEIAGLVASWYWFKLILPRQKDFVKRLSSAARSAKSLRMSLSNGFIAFLVMEGAVTEIDPTSTRDQQTAYARLRRILETIETNASERLAVAKRVLRRGNPGDEARDLMFDSLLDVWTHQFEQPLRRSRNQEQQYTGPLVRFMKTWCDLVLGEGEISTFQIGDYLKREITRRNRRKPKSENRLRTIVQQIRKKTNAAKGMHSGRR
jgi:hypothetical protein